MPGCRLVVGPALALAVVIFFRGSHAGNTAPVQPLCLWRHSVGSYLRDCGGDCELPLHCDGDLRDPLVAIVVCRLDHDAADCALRSTGHSQPNAHVDTRRLNLADRGLNPAAQKCLRWVKSGNADFPWPCPVYRRKQTSRGQVGMSVSCKKWPIRTPAWG